MNTYVFYAFFLISTAIFVLHLFVIYEHLTQPRWTPPRKVKMRSPITVLSTVENPPIELPKRNRKRSIEQELAHRPKDIVTSYDILNILIQAKELIPSAEQNGTNYESYSSS